MTDDLFQRMRELREKITNPIYYATLSTCERGKFIVVEPSEHTPRCFFCHPDDLEDVRVMIAGTGMRLVHLRDRPV